MKIRHLKCILAMIVMANGTQVLAQDWNQKSRFVGDNRIEHMNFGSAVAMSEYYMAGVSQNNAAVYIYRTDTKGDSWQFTQKIPLSSSNAIAYATNEDKIAISDSTMVIGDPYSDSLSNNFGAVRIYQLGSDSTWSLSQFLTYPTLRSNLLFGRSIDLHNKQLIVSSRAGVFIYEKSTSGTWALTSRLSPYTGFISESFQALLAESGYSTVIRNLSGIGNNSDGFGTDVAIFNDIAVVGAPKSDNIWKPLSMLGVADGDNGAAYIFKKNANGDWIQTQKIISSTFPSAYAKFGSSIELNEGHLVISAPNDSATITPGSSVSGAVFTYKMKSSGLWEEAQKIKVAGASSFGHGISIYHDRLAIGCRRGSSNNSNSTIGGRIFMYQLNNSSVWEQTHEFFPATAIYENFGKGLGLWKNRLAVGSSYEGLDENYQNYTSIAGAIYAFKQECSLSDTSYLNNSVSNNTTYQFADGTSIEISGDTSHTSTLSEASEYGCDSVVIENVYIGSARMAQKAEAFVLNYFPNPVQDYLTIRLSSSEEKVKVLIRSISGAILKQMDYTSTTEMRLDVSYLQSGMYLIEVNRNENAPSQFIISKH
ncbi:MAG: hypothetical protein ACI8P7_000188 [Candidatus Azotimanducaceae bacterium]|jgi:hypothetical protein